MLVQDSSGEMSGSSPPASPKPWNDGRAAEAMLSLLHQQMHAQLQVMHAALAVFNADTVDSDAG